MKTITGWDVREEYRQGGRDFSNIEIQWADFSGTDLSGINFSNSKISLVTFFRCNLTNANFSGCDIYSTSFHSTILKNAVFDKATLNWIMFDNANFTSTSMKNVSLSHATMINCLEAELNLSGASLFHVFRNPSEIPDSEIGALVAEIGTAISKVDMDRRLWIKTGLAQYMQDLGKKKFSEHQLGSIDEKDISNYGKQDSIYKKLETIFNELIETYGPKNPYRQKNSYKTDKKY